MKTISVYDYDQHKNIDVDLTDRYPGFYKDLLDLYVNDDPSIHEVYQSDFCIDLDPNKWSYDGHKDRATIFKQLKLPSGSCIAGGHIVNYLLGKGAYSNDIDIFLYGTDNLQKVQFILGQIEIDTYHRNNNYIDIHGTIKNVEGKNIDVNVQIILSEYTSFQEIINSFDLYPSQVGYADGKYWGTKRAIFCLTHRVNPFDISRANTSYVSRLQKYENSKGFQPILLNGIVKDEGKLQWGGWQDKLKSLCVQESEYEEATYNYSSYGPDKCIYRKNLQYIMALDKSDKSYSVTKEGRPLEIGTFQDLMEMYSKSLGDSVQGKLCALSYLGDSLIEVGRTFIRLLENPTYVPLTLRKKEGRFRGCPFNESIFYTKYQPIWKKESYQEASWKDRFCWWVLNEHVLTWTPVPIEIKNYIMTFMTVARALKRMHKHSGFISLGYS